MFDPSGEEPRKRLDVPMRREECGCHGAVVVSHVFVIREFDSGEPQRPQRGRKRHESSAVVPVSKGVHAEDACVKGGDDSCLLSDSDALPIELSSAGVERCTNLREILAQDVGWAALDLTHPTTIRHYTEERPLSTEAPAIVREVAGEDRPMPPADALRVHLQSTSPEHSLGVQKNTAQLVPERPPSLLRR